MSYTIITDVGELNYVSENVDPQKDNKLLRKIVSGLKDTIKENNLVTLSAPQIGFDKRIIVVRYGENSYHSYINPAVSNPSGLDLQKESCPSLPGRTFIMPRNVEFDVMYQTPLGDIKSQHLVGLAARVFLRGIDYLNGVNISDIGLEIDADFDDLTDSEKEEVIREYLESLDLKEKALKEEIENTPELKQLSDGIKFVESVKNGETKISAVIVSEEDQLKIIDNNNKFKEMTQGEAEIN